jgi:type I restriction enzyme S subunit
MKVQITQKKSKGYKQTEIGVIPEDWNVVRLNLLSNDIGDGIHSTPKYVDSSNYFFVNGNNLSDGRILITRDTKCISEDEYESLKKNLDNTTILMSINGTIGNLAFFNNETVVLGKSAAYIKLSQRIDKIFIYYLLQHSSIKKFYDNELTGTTIKNLSLASIRSTPVPIPPTKPEQPAIATALSDTDALIERLGKLIAKNKVRCSCSSPVKKDCRGLVGSGK